MLESANELNILLSFNSLTQWIEKNMHIKTCETMTMKYERMEDSRRATKKQKL